MALVLTKRLVKGSALTATEHDANMSAIETAVNTAPSGTDANAIHVATAGEIAGLTTKTTPVSADLLVIEDSAASNAKKKVTVGSLPIGVPASGIPAPGDAVLGVVSGAVKAFAAGLMQDTWLGGLAGETARALGSKLRDVVSVKDFGAKGDGTTDDTAAIQNVGSKQALVPVGRYKLTSGAIKRPGMFLGAGRDAVLAVATSVAGNNTAIYLQSNGATNYTGSGTLTQGSNQLTLASVSGLAVGNDVQLRLGTDPYDPNEEHLRYWTRITAISSLTVTFSDPIPENVNGTSHVLAKYSDPCRQGVIRDLAFDIDGSNTVDPLIWIWGAEGVVIENVRAINAQGPLLQMTECQNVVAKGLVLQGSTAPFSSAGRLLGAWGARNCTVTGLTGHGLAGDAIMFESQCRGITVDGLDVSTAPGNTGPFALVAGGCRGIVLRNLRLLAPAGTKVTVFQVAQAADVTVENLSLDGPAASYAVPFDGINLRGFLSYNNTLYQWHHVVEVVIPITTNMSGANIYLPKGVIKSVSALASSLTGITGGIYLLNTNGQGWRIDDIMTAGTWKTIVAGVGSVDYALNDTAGKKINIFSDGTVPAGTTLKLRLSIMTTTPEYLDSP